jgi:hypothetical protein
MAPCSCHTVIILLLHFRCTFVTLLFPNTVVTLLLHSAYIVVTLLSQVMNIRVLAVTRTGYEGERVFELDVRDRPIPDQVRLCKVVLLSAVSWLVSAVYFLLSLSRSLLASART